MIRVGIIGVGNCAKSLVEGVALYSTTDKTAGLAFPEIGGYRPRDIKFTMAVDVDHRKVGKPLCHAIYEDPNCAVDLCKGPLDENGVREVCMNTRVIPPPFCADGIAPHMEGFGLNMVFKTDSRTPREEFVEQLRENVDVCLIYLPVGSSLDTAGYVGCLLEAKVPFVNCIPEFIVSNPEWQKRIKDAGICAIGDDMRSQIGASVLSQVLQEMFIDRGAKVKCHIQTNQGGNTDFYNMTDKNRLSSKKISKENVIRAQYDLRGVTPAQHSIHAGPSDYIPYLQDNKVAHIRIEAEGFGGAPITLDCRLSVQDSPNSAGIVIDAIRYLATARDRGITGPLYGPSAATQKSPPKQMSFQDAYQECVSYV